MKEEFLHFIWEYQYFDKRNLKTWEGQVINILRPGQKNPDAGPDFSDARIKIGGTEWAGPVEIHVKSSQWNLHGHHL